MYVVCCERKKILFRPQLYFALLLCIEHCFREKIQYNYICIYIYRNNMLYRAKVVSLSSIFRKISVIQNKIIYIVILAEDTVFVI